jgi:hypothetical protein
MIAGAYWSARQESRDDAARRIEMFLRRLAEVSSEFASWRLKGATRRSATTHLAIDSSVIASALRTERTDVGGLPMPELGYSLGVWNGRSVSFSTHVGVFSRNVGNSAVLTSSDSSLFDDDTWRAVHAALVATFDPDRALVACQARTTAVGLRPWDGAWLRYERDGQTTEIRENRDVTET